MAVSLNRGTPSNHPFLAGSSLKLNHPATGDPPFMETSKSIDWKNWKTFLVAYGSTMSHDVPQPHVQRQLVPLIVMKPEPIDGTLHPTWGCILVGRWVTTIV